jgi:digeranylgeranylglycerophospholipid reductase
MTDQYDVVIAGAGPAGAQCARDAASRGYDVVVLETEAEDGFPKTSNKSTGGTFPPMLSAFNVPDDVVMQFTNNVVVESPNEAHIRRQPGAVLEFADFKRFLVRDGREKGAEYRFDARVARPVLEGGDIVGVQYNGDEEIRADVVVDATGPAAPLAKELGTTDLERDYQAIGIEHEFEGIDLAHPDFADLTDAMMLRLDHEYAPGGYSWIFHTGGDTAKVGVCFIQNESYKQYANQSRTVDGYLEHWLETDPRFADAERLPGKTHRGSAHIQPPGQMTTDNFIAVGDTVPTIDPLWGEGIHTGMKSGRAAAVTIDTCLTHQERDTSGEYMQAYENHWHSQVAPNMTTRLLMTELMYFASNERYDRLLQDLNQLDEGTLQAANGGSLRAISKLIHRGDIRLLTQFARHRLSDESWNIN